MICHIKKQEYKNNHLTQRSLLTETVFSQLWLTRVFLTSPCHRLQLQLIPNLFRTTVPYPCLHHTHTHTHTDSFPLGAHTCPHHPRNAQATLDASDLHHNDLKRRNVRGVKSPAGKSQPLTRKCKRSFSLISAQANYYSTLLKPQPRQRV